MINKEINLPPGWIWGASLFLKSFLQRCALPPLLIWLSFTCNYQREADKQNGPSNIQLSPQFDPKSFYIHSKTGNKAQHLVNLKELEMLISRQQMSSRLTSCDRNNFPLSGNLLEEHRWAQSTKHHIRHSKYLSILFLNHISAALLLIFISFALLTLSSPALPLCQRWGGGNG